MIYLIFFIIGAVIYYMTTSISYFYNLGFDAGSISQTKTCVCLIKSKKFFEIYNKKPNLKEFLEKSKEYRHTITEKEMQDLFFMDHHVFKNNIND